MAIRVRPDDVASVALPGRRSRELIGEAIGARACTVRLVEIGPDVAGEPRRGPHVHDGFEECIHVLSGEGITRTDAGELAVEAGDTVLMPPGERHATYNTGGGVLRLICFFPVSDIGPGTREFAGWEDRDGGAPRHA